jgi:hypothetical protein
LIAADDASSDFRLLRGEVRHEQRERSKNKYRKQYIDSGLLYEIALGVNFLLCQQSK